MENQIEKDFIDENNILSYEEAKELKQLEDEFIKSYIANKDNMSVDAWLFKELKEHLPDREENEIKNMTNEILETIKINDENMKSLESAYEKGISKETWFANKLQEATSYMSNVEKAQYLQSLDEEIKRANDAYKQTITTKAGTINNNMNLDGFIAEQHHANSFNLNAAVKESGYRAEVLVPKDGQGYGKNSVDIVIRDSSGKIVQRYQAKYGKTAEDTIKMIKEGNYNNQRIIVPEEQLEQVKNEFPNKTVVSTLEIDGIKSKPLSKPDAKQLQKEAQSGKWNDLNWNEYKTKDLAIGIVKQAGQAALQGAAIGVGMEIATKLINGEEIDGEEVVKKAIETGADFGIKAAASGALKVGVEKGVIKCIPKGTPAGIIANIAYVGIENIKVMGKVAKGEMTISEGIDKMQQVTVSTVAGISLAAKGTKIGAKIGKYLGPVGAGIGGFIGGTVGYIAGSKTGETVVKGYQKIRDAVKSSFNKMKGKVGEFLEFIFA
ncbi:MAG: hypothetical protein KatS3mg079_313 [Caloramator sp.]|nr:MAG: hypothetical protein KatS3mg079_313 [Caloramator sp.]